MHLLIVLTAALSLQLAAARPDFSGSWKMVPDRSQSPLQSPPVTEMMFVIDQRADQVRLDVTSGAAAVASTVYPIIKTPPAGQPAGDERRAFWDGNRLVVERGGTISGQTVSARQALTLSSDRSEMTVERIVVVQHGYSMRGTKNYATVKDVFVRVTP
jgi:hypothetical protein